MPNRELLHTQKSVALAGLAAATTGTVTSTGIDLLGYDACTFNLHYGATAPAPTSYEVQESDTLGSGYTAAPAASVIDDGGAHAVSTTRRIGYVGTKRFARVVVVLSASTILTITASLGYAAQVPIDNPTA